MVSSHLYPFGRIPDWGSGRRHPLIPLINATIFVCCPDKIVSLRNTVPLLIWLFDRKKKLLRFRPEYPRSQVGRSNRSRNHLRFGLPCHRETQSGPGSKLSPRSTGSLTIREAQNYLTSLNERRDLGSLQKRKLLFHGTFKIGQSLPLITKTKQKKVALKSWST